ncbi:PQQ-binding-like beta-propeller repeat protein [Halobaculum sp. D14]|uniref:outer membrane protein assembly factor BamB family protein n=1 Tax=Halobaculum sp. D14 TaxID=3421642 RepID=UPI003EBB5C90
MVPTRLTRRGALALAGGALTTGCLDAAPTSGDADRSGIGGTPDGSPAAPADWPMLGHGPAHTGANPAHAGGEPTSRRRRAVDGPLTTPTVVGETAYVTRGAPAGDGPQATVEAYALGSGARRWSLLLTRDGDPVRFTYAAPNSDRRPVYHGGRLYVAVDDRVAVVDPGGPELRGTTESVEALPLTEPPTVADAGVFAGGPSGLAAFDHGGALRWTLPRSPDEDSWQPALDRGARVAAVGDDAVYVSTGAALRALDPADGTRLWLHEPDDPSATSVVLAGDALVRAGFHGVEAVGRDGSRRWLAEWPGNAVVRPAVADGTVYVAGLTGHVAAYDLDGDGERLWHRSLPPERFAQGTVPAVSDGGLHVLRVDADAGTVRVYGLNRDDGSTAWTTEHAGTRARGVVPASGRYVFTTETTPPEQRESSTVGAGQDTTGRLWVSTPPSA